jgi:hypothetical protein
VAFLVAGCGEDSDGGEPEATTEVTITLDPDGPGGEQRRSVEVVCSSNDPALCPQVEDLTAEDLEPVPPETACTEIYGGPDVVTIAGTLRGERVDAELNRTDGCEIERFDRLTPLLRELFGGYTPGEALAP